MNAPWVSRSGAELGPDRVDLGEEREVKRAAQEGDAGAAAGTGLEPDGALHGAQVPEPPELEGVLQVNEVLAGGVLRPVGRGVLVDRLVDGDELGRLYPRLADVPLQNLLRHRVAMAGEITEERVVDRWRPQRLRQHRLRLGPGREDGEE